MAGRQFFTGFGNFQQAPDFGTGYGNAFGGMPNTMFMPGPHAVPGQQLGGHPSGLRLPFSSQPAEDPALFVNFDDDDEDFSLNSRAAAARSQPMAVRRPATHVQASMQPPLVSRQQQMGGSAPPAANSHPSRNMSAAEQELEDLKRRIAEKEKQMKAKRQGSQGFGGMPARSRSNPAHGPVLRGLHRKPPVGPPAQGSKEADLFLQKVAAELPTSSTGPSAAVQRAQAAAGTRQASRVPPSQGAQPTLQAVKTASATAAKSKASTAEVTKSASSDAVSREQHQTAAKPLPKQSAVSQPAAAAPKAATSQAATASAKSSQPAKTAQPLPSSKAASSSKPLLPAGSPAATQKAAAKPQAAASAAAKSARQADTSTTPGVTARQTRTQRTTAPVVQAAAADVNRAPGKTSASQTRKPGSPAQLTSEVQTNRGAPTNSLPAKVTATLDVTPADAAADWEAHQGVPVQSGYALSDSPLPEEEDNMQEEEASDVAPEASRANESIPSALRASTQQKQDKVERLDQSQPAKALGSAAAPQTKTALQAQAASVAHKPAALAGSAPPDVYKASIGANSGPSFVANADSSSVAALGSKATTHKTAGKDNALAAANKSVAKESITAPSTDKAAAARRPSNSVKVDTPIRRTKQPAPATMAAVDGQARTPQEKLSIADSAKQHRQVPVDSAKASGTQLATPTGSKVGAATSVTAGLPATHKSAKAAETTQPNAAASSVALSAAGRSVAPVATPHGATNGVLSKASTPAAVHVAHRMHSQPEQEMIQVIEKPVAAQRKAVAQSGQTAGPKSAAATGSAPSKSAAGHIPAIAHSSALPGTTAEPAASTAALRESTPPPPSSASKGQFHSFKAQLPIPGLASPDLPPSDEDVPVSSRARPIALAADQGPGPASFLYSEALPPLPMLPAPTVQAISNHALADPSSPQALPVVSHNAQAGLQKGFSSRSYSGEDMDIDEEPQREPLPPLPTEPFPTGLELATIDNSQQLAAISADDRDTLMEELSGINARTDELRIQKRFLNDMFARVKQEYLERRLRQQQIEQLLGYKPHIPALPSTLADAPGPSNALALRQASEGPSEPQQASPGEHRQSRKAELQSRAELHKARLDALQAKQRQSTATAAGPASQIAMSPMTSKAIVDLTTKQSPLARQPAATAPPAQLDIAAPKTAAGTTAASVAAEGSAAAKPAAVQAAAAPVAVSLQPPQQRLAVSQSVAAAQRLEKQADSQGRGAASVSTSQQLPKRKRSRSRSPTGTVNDGRARPGSQRQAASSSHRRTRSRSPVARRSRSPPAKRPRPHQQAPARSRRHSVSTNSSSSLSPDRRRRRRRSYTSSPSSGRPANRHSRRSPPRHRGRKSPSPRGRPRRHSPARRPSQRRSPSASAPRQRASSPNRPASKGRARGSPVSRPRSARSPTGQDRRHTGRKASPSSSRTPSPTKRKTAAVKPAQQRPHDSPQKAVVRRSSPVARANPDSARNASGPIAQDVAAAKGDAPEKPSQPAARPHDVAEMTTNRVPPAVDIPAPPTLPPPPSALPVSLAQFADQQLPLAPQHPQANAAKPKDAPKVAGLAPFDRKSKRPRAQPVADQPSVGNYPKPQHQEEVSKVPHPAVPAANAKSAQAEAAEAFAHGSQPAQSFDGKESFISLDPDEGPVSNAASVEQPAAASQIPVPQSVQHAQELGSAARAQPVLPDAPELPVTAPVVPTSAAPGQQAVKGSTAAQTDRHDIRPDVFSPASKQRPSSAASEGPSAAKASEADAGQKPLAPPKAKAAARGNIQIVLATKHKQEASKSGLPFPSTFQALAAQGLPPQALISAEQLPPLPQPRPVPQPETAGHKYDSPLKAFRSYRLLSTFQAVSQLPLTSASFTHRLDPHWPLCTYDIRGSCRDSKCPFQHASDYQLENMAVLRDLHQQAVRMGSRAALPALPGGEITSVMMTALAQQAIRGVPSPHIALPSAPGASPVPSPSKARAQARIPKERRRQLASEEPLPLYASTGVGSLAVQNRPFTSQLLQLVSFEHQGMLRLLLSGPEGYDRLVKGGPVANAGLDQAPKQGPAALAKAADKTAGRYFQLANHEGPDPPAAATTAAPKATEAAASEAQRSALLAEYEQQVAADPGSEELWLLFALQHIDFGAHDSMQGHKLMSCLKCISKGLEADSSFTCLWLLYLPLYRRHLRTKPEPDNESHKVAETCLSHSRPCYQLWLTAVHFQPDWQLRATLLQRGIVALSQTRPGNCRGVGKEEAAGWAAMRSSCVLDLALRLLLLWSGAEAHDVAANWVAELVKLAGQGKATHAAPAKDPLAMEERAVGPAARQALLAQLHQQPGNAAVLWLSCAQLAAYNTLPPQTVHSLGCIQQPVVVDWQQAPPASLHSRVRSILTTAASAGLACLDLKATPQVMDDATIQKATSAAWPRQALALSIAHWELTTESTPLLGPLPAPLGPASISPAAASLLMLGSLTSKAACAVQQPLPAQAMDAWQHATWPVGDTQLLCMSVVLAAEPQLQAFANRFGKEETQDDDQAAGRLQQAVAAAGSLLAQLAATVCKAIEGSTDTDKPDDEEEDQQPLRLHPAAVGSLAARVYQLSSGNPQVAMAFLVAAVLPEWQWEVPGAGQLREGPAAQNNTSIMGPIVLSDGEDDPQATPMTASRRERVYRKRARSPSRSAIPRKPVQSGASPRNASRRQNRHSSSSSSTSSSYSGSASSSGSSSRSSGSYSSSDATSSSSDSMQPGPKRQRYADAISEGLRSELSADGQAVEIDWPAVEAFGSLAGLDVVTEAFHEVSRLAVPSQDPHDFEEGEIRAVDLDMKRRHAAHWGHNLALYRALCGEAPGAFTALQAALRTADGSRHLQCHIWQEMLHLGSAELQNTPEDKANPAASIPAEAHVAALHSSQSPQGWRQKQRLLQHFQHWQQEDDVLTPLALPRQPIQEQRARALLEQPTMYDGEAMKNAVLAMLAHLGPAQETPLIEAMASAMPATAAKAQLVLDLAARKPQEGQYASWVLPLAATALLNAAPPPAPHLWLQGIVLAERHSRAAALELSTCATARHPYSKALSKRHAALQASADGPAASTSSGISKARAEL